MFFLYKKGGSSKPVFQMVSQTHHSDHNCSLDVHFMTFSQSTDSVSLLLPLLLLPSLLLLLSSPALELEELDESSLLDSLLRFFCLSLLFLDFFFISSLFSFSRLVWLSFIFERDDIRFFCEFKLVWFFFVSRFFLDSDTFFSIRRFGLISSLLSLADLPFSSCLLCLVSR